MEERQRANRMKSVTIYKAAVNNTIPSNKSTAIVTLIVGKTLALTAIYLTHVGRK